MGKGPSSLVPATTAGRERWGMGAAAVTGGPTPVVRRPVRGGWVRDLFVARPLSSPAVDASFVLRGYKPLMNNERVSRRTVLRASAVGAGVLAAGVPAVAL